MILLGSTVWLLLVRAPDRDSQVAGGRHRIVTPLPPDRYDRFLHSFQVVHRNLPWRSDLGNDSHSRHARANEVRAFPERPPQEAGLSWRRRPKSATPTTCRTSAVARPMWSGPVCSQPLRDAASSRSMPRLSDCRTGTTVCVRRAVSTLELRGWKRCRRHEFASAASATLRRQRVAS